MIAHDAKHVLAIRRVALERSVLSGKQRALRIRTTRQDRTQHAADRATFLTVVGNARLHEHRAEVGISKTRRAIAPREIRDFLRRKCCHQHADFKHDRPEFNRVLVAFDIKASRLRVVELDQVDRREIARGVVEEHVLRAGIARVDASAFWAGVPRVDRAVVLHARISATPRREVDLVPKFVRRNGLGHRAINATHEVPVTVAIKRIEEAVGDTHRVVRVLTTHRRVCLAVEVVVELEIELLRELLLIVTKHLHAFNERCHFDLFTDFPIHEMLDVWVIEIEANHLGCASRRATRLDRRRCAVTDLEEAHET